MAGHSDGKSLARIATGPFYGNSFLVVKAVEVKRAIVVGVKETDTATN